MNEALSPSLVRYGAELEAVIERELIGVDRAPARGRRTWRRARRRGFQAALTALVASAAIVWLMSVGPSGGSLVARAAAALRTNGTIVHFVENVHLKSAHHDSRASAQIWTSGDRSRAIVTAPTGHGHRSTREVVIDGDHETEIIRNHGRHTTITGSTAGRCAPLLGFCNGNVGDPVTSISRLYRANRLQMAGVVPFKGRPVQVIAGTAKGSISGEGGKRLTIHISVYVNPRTADPVEIEESTRSGWTLTAKISGFGRLPLTRRSRQELRLTRDVHDLHVVKGEFISS